MVIKFTEPQSSQILEVENTNEGVSFFIHEYGEEQVGQYITLPLSEVNNLIKFLQSLNQYQ
jgi:hypothetical protein